MKTKEIRDSRLQKTTHWFLAVIVVSGLLLSACMAEETTKGRDDKMETFMVGLIYLKPDKHDLFNTYVSKAVQLINKYGGSLERVIQPKMLAKGTLELPNQIHILHFPDAAQAQALKHDAEYQKIITQYRDPSVLKMIVMPSVASPFEFRRETGDQSKTFGVALLNYADAEGSKALFDEYHEKACEIIPEFGAHFERFLVPVDIKGDMEKPDEIHVFYFDAPDGMKKMGEDPRMQKLFPMRDKSLKNLNFVIGQAL